MIKRVAVLLLVAAFYCGTNAYAIWDVTIESKTVGQNETNVSLAMMASWDIPLAGLAVPVIVREIDPGSFWTGALPYDTGGNAFNHPFQYNVSWNWSNQWANFTEEMRPGVPFGNCFPDGDTGYDGISPDHFSIHAAGIVGTPIDQDRDVVTITFDVTGSLGQFEFDTACFSTALGTIYLIDDAFPPVDHGPIGPGETSFNKGIVTIVESDCYCGIRGDVNHDASTDPLDVSYLVNKVYLSLDALHDYTATCPYPNGDVNCDASTDPLDVSFLVNKVYLSLDALCKRCP